MALIDKKILTPIRYHQDNANTVIGQASTMKALFDQGAEDLRVKLNGVIDELLATTGAQQIGIDPAKGLGNTLADALTNIKNYMNLGASSISAEVIGTGSGDNVQAQLLWLMNQIKTMVLGQIPEGTISIDKLTIELANLINGHTMQLAQKANKQQQSWITPTLLNGWVDYSVNLKCGYYKDDMGIVRIRGAVKSGVATQGTPIFILPEGYRPSQTADYRTIIQDVVANIRVYSDGNVAVISGSATQLSLDGITFRAEG